MIITIHFVTSRASCPAKQIISCIVKPSTLSSFSWFSLILLIAVIAARGHQVHANKETML